MGSLTTAGLGTGSNTQFHITLTSNGTSIADFNNTQNYTWVIANITGTPITTGTYLATASNAGISTGTTSSSLFTLDTSGFVAANATEGGGSSFYLEAVTASGGENLEIGYNAARRAGDGITAPGRRIADAYRSPPTPKGRPAC